MLCVYSNNVTHAVWWISPTQVHPLLQQLQQPPQQHPPQQRCSWSHAVGGHVRLAPLVACTTISARWRPWRGCLQPSEMATARQPATFPYPSPALPVTTALQAAAGEMFREALQGGAMRAGHQRTWRSCLGLSWQWGVMVTAAQYRTLPRESRSRSYRQGRLLEQLTEWSEPLIPPSLEPVPHQGILLLPLQVGSSLA